MSWVNVNQKVDCQAVRHVTALHTIDVLISHLFPIGNVFVFFILGRLTTTQYRNEQAWMRMALPARKGDWYVIHVLVY